MDQEDTNLEIKCENMMNVVVESRKRFGKMCVDYEQKTSIMESKLLNLQVETFKNYKFKPKQAFSVIEDSDFKDLDDFTVELIERKRKLEELRKKMKATQAVVAQLKKDSIGCRFNEPVTASVLLARAKSKEIM